MLILVPSNTKSYGTDETWFIKKYSMSSMTMKRYLATIKLHQELSNMQKFDQIKEMS